MTRYIDIKALEKEEKAFGTKAMKKFFEDFCDSYASVKIGYMQEFLKDKEYLKIRAEAHVLRAAFLSFGFDKLNKIAKDIESTIDNKNYEPLETLVKNIKIDYEKTMIEFKRLRPKYFK